MRANTLDLRAKLYKLRAKGCPQLLQATLRIGHFNIYISQMSESCYNSRATVHRIWLMAQLEAFQMAGFNLEMYSEDHSPPHFHVIKDNWNIRIKFNLSIVQRDIVWASKYPESLKECPLSSAESKELLTLMKRNCKALNKQWKTLHPSRRG
jgi:hypothetical protein